MYDNVNIFQPMVGADVPTLGLDNVSEAVNKDTGEIVTKGRLGNLNVCLAGRGLTIKGSLCKFYHNGSNVYPLDVRQTAEAIEKLEDTLHYSLDEAMVTGLEFGTNFLLSHPVSMYLERLGYMSRMERGDFAGSLYYKSNGRRQSKVVCFYDKIADARAKAMDIPIGFNDANVLRYEIRYKGRLCTQLKEPSLFVPKLTDKRFYRKMLERYNSTYQAINKKTILVDDNMERVTNVKEAYDVFVAKLIAQAPPNEVADFIDELERRKVFADRKYLTRLRQKINNVTQKSNFTKSDELIRELDNEVSNCLAYI